MFLYLQKVQNLCSKNPTESITTEKAIVLQKAEPTETDAESEEKPTVGRIQAIKRK